MEYNQNMFQSIRTSKSNVGTRATLPKTGEDLGNTTVFADGEP